mmetsp:Transcript_10774/g.29727  ORF Transcript_10774/g.29727 Transcript_10774/m.29727 type:complete len:255 (+) Transcript_10774:771-1535(+)
MPSYADSWRSKTSRTNRASRVLGTAIGLVVGDKTEADTNTERISAHLHSMSKSIPIQSLRVYSSNNETDGQDRSFPKFTLHAVFLSLIDCFIARFVWLSRLFRRDTVIKLGDDLTPWHSANATSDHFSIVRNNENDAILLDGVAILFHGVLHFLIDEGLPFVTRCSRHVRLRLVHRSAVLPESRIGWCFHVRHLASFRLVRHHQHVAHRKIHLEQIGTDQGLPARLLGTDDDDHVLSGTGLQFSDQGGAAFARC